MAQDPSPRLRQIRACGRPVRRIILEHIYVVWRAPRRDACADVLWEVARIRFEDMGIDKLWVRRDRIWI